MFRKKKKNEKLRKYINSLQFRMCLIFIIVGIVPIMLIKHGILTNYQDQAVKQRISIIQSQSDLITAQISKTDHRCRAAADGESLQRQDSCRQ